MKNAINYYYDLTVNNIRQNGKNYYFEINNEKFILFPVAQENMDFKIIYQLNLNLLNQGFPCHQIILNKDGKIITEINNKNYALVKVFVQNRVVEVNDLFVFNNVYFNVNDFSSLKRNDWKTMWINKIDYFEYQINQIGKKYPLIRESFSYFVGLSETAIQFIDSIAVDNSVKLIISHKRFKSDNTLFDIYNPFNFIVDLRVRDVSEYYKTMFFRGNDILEDIKRYIIYAGLSAYECNMLFARMLFPSYYFDCYENIIVGEKSEECIEKIINLIEKYEVILKKLYQYLRTFTSMAEIEWIIKT